jgi:cob(I)alamin adenosyltransferase
MSDNNSRITKVTTRNGDAGQTRLGNNVKVSKDEPLIRALGSTDELNSAIGLLRCYIDETSVDSMLAEQQQVLFDIGAVLAMAGEYDPSIDHRAHRTRRANRGDEQQAASIDRICYSRR